MASSNLFTSYASSAWRTSILQQLNEREKQEHTPFEDLIQDCNKHFESTDTFRSDYLKLIHKFNRLKLKASEAGEQVSNQRQQNHQFVCEKCPALEKRLSNRQENIKFLLKKNKEQAKNFEAEKNEIQNGMQLLKKEYEALQTYANAKITEHYTLDLQHKELINMVMTSKTNDVERLNSKDEKISRLKKKLRSRKLEKAVEKIKISEDDRQVHTFTIGATFFNREIHDAEVNALKWITGIEKYRNVLATGGGDRKVKLWMMAQSSCLLLEPELTNSNASITSIDVDSGYLLASSSDFASRLWKINESRLVNVFTGHLNKVTAVKFLGTSTKSVSGSLDRTIKVWDVNKCACNATYFTGSMCNDLTTRQGHDSEVISGHFDKAIRFFDTRTNTISSYIKLQDRITSLEASQNDSYLLSCDRDNELKLIDLRMNQVVRNFYADGFKVGCDWTRATISPDSEYVAAGSANGSIFIWNANTGKLEKELRGGHSSNVNACSWSPNGQTFISCDRNKRITVWDSGYSYF